MFSNGIISTNYRLHGYRTFIVAVTVAGEGTCGGFEAVKGRSTAVHPHGRQLKIELTKTQIEK